MTYLLLPWLDSSFNLGLLSFKTQFLFAISMSRRLISAFSSLSSTDSSSCIVFKCVS